MPTIRGNGRSVFISTVVLDTGLHNRARALGINVSETLREALTEKILEKERPLT